MAIDERTLNARLKWIIDSTSQKAAENSVKNVEQLYKELEQVQKGLFEELKKGDKASLKAMADLSFQQEHLLKQIKEITDAEKEHEKEVRKVELAKEREIKNTIKNIRLQSKEIVANARLMRDTASDIDRIAKPLALAGTAVVGGIFAFATKYVNDAKEANQVTKEWKKAQDDLNKSGERIGKILAQEALPFIKLAADMTSKIASFIEKNPQVVDFALKAGLLSLAVGTMGKAVSSGIRLYADIKLDKTLALQLTAAQMQLQASNNQMKAAGLQAGKTVGGGGVLGGAAGVAGIASTVVSILAAIGGGVAVGSFINDTLAKMGVKGFIRSNTFATGGAFEVGKVFGKTTGLDSAEIERKSIVFAAIIGKLTGAIDESSPLWQKATRSIKGTAKALSEMSGGVSGSQYEEQIVDAYEKMMSEELKITQGTSQKIQEVMQDANDAIQKANASNRARIDEIRSSAGSQRKSVLGSYAINEAKALRDYNEQRKEIAQEGGEEIIRIEQDLQKELRKLNKEHSERMDELVRDRDALGIVKEQRAFEGQRKEAERSAHLEIRQRRQEIAQKLEDLSKEYAYERSQRLAEMQLRIQEINAQASKEIAIQETAHRNELKEIQDSKNKQLRELQLQKHEELKRNREAFISQVRQLDASLLGEQQLRQQYYTKMLSDVDQFLASYRNKLSGTSTTSSNKTISATASGFPVFKISGKSAGGYTSGIVNTGEKGLEYILNNKTTKLAENLLGRSLTQEAIVGALLKTRGSVSITDNRRFEKMPAPWERNQMNREMEKMLQGVFS